VTGTGTAPHADTAELIRTWRASSKQVEQIAADLALKIETGQLHRWEELPRQSLLADAYDVTGRTITSVKSLLGAPTGEGRPSPPYAGSRRVAARTPASQSW
jgi:DNA-binding transcriptional MocR family regulator